MKYIVINGKELKSKKEFYQEIREKLEFPEYFGNNLDALHDSLSEVNDVTVLLLNKASLEENLGSYSERILRVFRDSEKENPGLSVKLVFEEE